MAAILFDLDGVIYEGDRPVPGAAQAVAWIQDRTVSHLFLTNTTSRPRRALVEKLARFGVKVSEESIFTPPVAAVQWLKSNVQGPVALFVPEVTKPEFAEVPILEEDADSGAGAVVLGDLGEEWNFQTLNRAFRLLIAEPRPVLLALGMTRYWRAADGLRLDVAPFVAALEQASGTSPVVVGKPAAAFYEMALARLGAPVGDVFMIGDDIRGDIDGSQKLGLQGILVRTGKFRPSDLNQGISPYAILESVADLPQWWQAHVAG